VTSVLRRSRPDDFEAWYALRSAVAAEGVWIGAEAPVGRDEDSFVARVDADDVLDVMAEVDGELVGTIGAGHGRGIVSFWMCVADGHRGLGIGRLLLDACLEWAAEIGAHKVTLEVWPHNGPAISLYRSAGFEIEGRKVRHYRRRNGELWDALMMAKVLDATAPGSPMPDAAV
jgi:ribosomal protein S18 acetylase RimI-like enzyme